MTYSDAIGFQGLDPLAEMWMPLGVRVFLKLTTETVKPAGLSYRVIQLIDMVPELVFDGLESVVYGLHDRGHAPQNGQNGHYATESLGTVAFFSFHGPILAPRGRGR